MNPAAVPIILGGAKIGKELAKTQSEIQKNAFHYDFTGLVTGLFLILAFAKGIEVYVQIVSGVQGFWFSILRTAGVAMPTNAPPAIVQLVNEGYAGIQYWDLIKGLCIAIVGAEWLRYKDVLSYAGHGVFAMILGFFALITVPSLMKRLKENQVLSN